MIHPNYSARKRQAEMLLTLGRILKYAGLVLSILPIAIALPGLSILVVGNQMMGYGETIWNNIHHLPRKWRD